MAVPLAQVDRLGATEERCGEVESAIFDLFAHLGATEEQLDFPVLYASARQVPLMSPCDAPGTGVLRVIAFTHLSAAHSLSQAMLSAEHALRALA